MTRIAANRPCEACGGMLVPHELAFKRRLPPETAYVCVQCGRAYRWAGDPPRLTLIESPRDRDDPE